MDKIPHDGEHQGAIRREKRRISPLVFILCIAISLLVGFGVGIYKESGQNPLASLSQKDQLDLSSVQQTYNYLNDKYDGKLNTQQLVEGASRGLVSAAGDPYTVYFDRKEAETFDNDLSGTFQGIGAELDKKDGKLIIVTPLKDSPAEKVDLKPLDVIARVNDEDTTEWSVDKAISKIRGKEGTTVKLTIVRGAEVKEVSIVRDTISSPSVESEIRGETGIITISRFGEDTTALARKAAYEFKEKGVKSVVLDLRGNGGGYLETAQEISSLWLKKDQVVVEEKRGKEVIETHKASGDAILEGIPTVVLVNQGSASASEIVAGALQENGAAKLVGETTFGKGSVQTIVDLKNGAKLKVTIARWYTPKGTNISKHGIKPDVVVKYAEGDTKENDTQLNKALELLK